MVHRAARGRLARPLADGGPREQLFAALLDELDLGARRRLFDPVGRYNRPDVLRLVVDDRPKPHLVSLAGAGGGRAASGTGPPGPG